MARVQFGPPGRRFAVISAGIVLLVVVLVAGVGWYYSSLLRSAALTPDYSPEELRGKITAAGFDLETLRFLNRAAVPGWWLNSRVLKRRVMPKGQLKFFKWIMPLLKLEEERPPSFGLSLLALATKRGEGVPDRT